MKTINERTFEFAKEIVRICRKLEQDDKVTQAIGMQLLRAGTSIGANYEEALGGQSHADFTAKLSISLKEARETYYWLKLLAETQSLNPELISPLLQESDELIRILVKSKMRCQSSSCPF